MWHVSSRLEDDELTVDLTGVEAGPSEVTVVCEGHLTGLVESANGAIAALAAAVDQLVEPPANALSVAERVKHPNAYAPLDKEG